MADKKDIRDLITEQAAQGEKFSRYIPPSLTMRQAKKVLITAKQLRSRRNRPEGPFTCAFCNKPIKGDKMIWRELNICSGKWAEPGKAYWSDGPHSLGCYPFHNLDCFRQGEKCRVGFRDPLRRNPSSILKKEGPHD